jgi:hypothetical protein
MECLHVDLDRITCRYIESASSKPVSHAYPRRLRPGASDQRPDPGRSAVDLSDAQGQLRAELYPGRPDHPDLPTDRLAAATLDRLPHRPVSQAVAAAGGHGLHAGRHPDAGVCRQLPGDPAGGSPGGRRLIDLPPGNLARRAPGLRRALWPGAIDLPGRRQHRQRAGAVARGGDHHSLWPGQHRLVRTV